MTPDQIVRAWKDADYGATLPQDEAAVLPPSPVGAIDFGGDALDLAAGGHIAGTQYLETLGCCHGFTERGYCDFTAGYPYCSGFCITIWLSGGC
jgi:mersacidin/lichenicidin family type 2 lantibiotic